MAAPASCGGEPAVPGAPGRTRPVPGPYPVTPGDGIVVLDPSRAVILDLTALRLGPEWRAYYVNCAAGFTWPVATRLEVDRRGGWHAYRGSGPGCRWSSWYLPDVAAMTGAAVR